jgi:hypothetical protein
MTGEAASLGMSEMNMKLNLKSERIGDCAS